MGKPERDRKGHSTERMVCISQFPLCFVNRLFTSRSDSLPPLKEQLRHVKIKTPIEQHMTGRSGLFRQENVEKRKLMSVREWVELCRKEEFRAPGVDEVGLHARSIIRPKTKQPKTTTKARPVPKELIPKSEELDCLLEQPQHTDRATSIVEAGEKKEQENVKQKAGRINQSRLVRQANLAHRLQMDNEFLESFDPHQDWLPPDTMATDYTQEFCQKLERQYWRNCGLGKSAWYGADTQGKPMFCNSVGFIHLICMTLLRIIVYRRDNSLERCASGFDTLSVVTVFKSRCSRR